MRTAFLREGFKTEGLFAKTEFIPRITASEAKRAAVAEAMQVFSDLLKMKADPTSSPFGHLAPFAHLAKTQVPEPTPAPQDGKPVLVVDNVAATVERMSRSEAASHSFQGNEKNNLLDTQRIS